MKTQYLYVMGAESGAGKSSVCLSILAQLLTSGFTEDQLAYIKPVTQCTEKQPVALFCEQNNISYRDLGCLVFNKGFSKNYIDSLTPDSTALMNRVLDSIHTIAKDKAVVIIDGIGDPASGSVVGVSNVDVASNLACKVIFVGKPGIGAALDNTVLCVTFMQTKGLKDIGIIYNKIQFNTVTDTENYVAKRLTELLPGVTLLGFIKNNEKPTQLPAGFNSFILEKSLVLPPACLQFIEKK